MILPTPRAVAIFLAGVPVALFVVIYNPDAWLWSFDYGALVLIAIGTDFVLALPGRQLETAMQVPASLQIGEHGSVVVGVTTGGYRRSTRFELVREQRPGTEFAETIGLDVAPGQRGEVRFPVLARRRGKIELDAIWVRWRGPLGLIQVVKRIAVGRAIDVVPNVRGVRSSVLQFFSREALFGNKVQEQKGSGTEFEALRDYEVGLDSRFIDWKHSARHRKLVCKEFQTERNHQIVLAFDTGYLMVEPLDGLPRLDHAINAGLLLSWISLQGGDFVGMLGFDEVMRQYQQPRRGVSNFSRLQRATASLEYRHAETNFTLGLAELSARLKRRALVILFTDFVDTVTADRPPARCRIRDPARRGAARLRRRGAGSLRGRRAVGHCPRFPARPPYCVRAAVAHRRALSRRAEPIVADRVDQPLSADQATGAPVSIEAEIMREVGRVAAQHPVIVLKSNEFRRTREQSWQELERLVERAEKHGVRTLPPNELQRLPQLYRAALSSLSVARAIALDRQLLLYLESLALRAYLAIYSPRTSFASAASQFLRAFPAAVLSARWHLAIATLAFVVGGVAGFWLTIDDESWFTTLVPAGLAGGRGVASTRESLLASELFAPWPGFAESLAIVANFLFSHNTLVGILTFGLGLFAGVPTVLLLAYQGLILGAFLALHHDRGLAVDFVAWVSIHGVTEITAILLCGAAGLVIAEKILFPDRYSRADSLAMNGRRAAEIAVGAVLMFFVAAILEGCFRQLVASTPWRLVVAALTAAGWLTYLRLVRPVGSAT